MAVLKSDKEDIGEFDSETEQHTKHRSQGEKIIQLW